MCEWKNVPHDVFYQILGCLETSKKAQDLVSIRSVCKAWRSACLGYTASIEASISIDALPGLCRSFPSLICLRIRPAGRFGTAQRLPDLSPLEACQSLGQLRLSGFKYPQPRDVKWIEHLPLTSLLIEDSQPAAVAMPFLLKTVEVHHLACLQHLKISPPIEQRAGNCNYLFENVIFRLKNLLSLELGSAAFNKSLKKEDAVPCKLTSLELVDCGILPDWMGDILGFLPKLEILSIVRPMHPSDWPYHHPCGELSLSQAPTSLRSLRVHGATVMGKSCNHLQLEELALGFPRAMRNWDKASTAAIATIAAQTSLRKLELLDWDKVADCSPLSDSSVEDLSLIDCSFDAYYELIGGVAWRNVVRLHCKDNLQPMELRGLSGDLLFVKFFGCPNLKCVSGSGWIIRRLSEIHERLHDDSLTPSGFKAEASYLTGIVFL